MIRYFAYGSNMDRDMMRTRCRQAVPCGVATLPGFRFIITSDGYASIVRCPRSVVYGIVWRLAPRDLAALNLYENLAAGLYTTMMTAIRSAGRNQSALTYVARSRIKGRPRPGYMAGVIAAARQWDLPADYIDEIHRAARGCLRPAKRTAP
jgi:cation transport regulator ChaC